MATGKLWVILNPAAGKGKAAGQRPKIERFMKAAGRPFEIIVTKGPGDAMEIASRLPLGEDDATVAAGGDGTCNEVANGLLARGEGRPPALAVLPIGRGNDFAWTPGISENVEEALRAIAEGGESPVDCGFVKGCLLPQGRYFVNGVGVGFDAKVGFAAARMRIKTGASYALGALAVLARGEPSPLVRVTGDGGELTLRAALVSVVNGRRMGGSFYMGPDALIDDGLLDVCCVRDPQSRLRLLRILGRYTKGTQGELSEVSFSRARRVVLEALEGGMDAHCDGETVCAGGRRLEIECAPGALRLVGARRV
jgi:YegS/Rv2252/BmrU family lipid kinase